MRIAITGANGFIGQHVVSAAVASGHQVLAIVRSNTLEAWQDQSDIDVFKTDLTEFSQELEDKLQSVDVLIHLAAVMSGDHQYRDTIGATNNVINAMTEAGVSKLVGLSSISVLDYVQQEALSEVDESLERNPRDNELGPYARMKRDQEIAFESWRGDRVVLRPGIVYDEQNLSTAHVGFLVGNKGFAATHRGQVPVIHVKDVALACVKAAETTFTENKTIHLVNDALPHQGQYITHLKQMGQLGTTISMPWRLFSTSMGLLRFGLNFAGKTPDSLKTNSIAARQKPFRFSNAAAKRELSWSPTTGLE